MSNKDIGERKNLHDLERYKAHGANKREMFEFLSKILKPSKNDNTEVGKVIFEKTLEDGVKIIKNELPKK
jgi:hypothetical protein